MHKILWRDSNDSGGREESVACRQCPVALHLQEDGSRLLEFPQGSAQRKAANVLFCHFSYLHFLERMLQTTTWCPIILAS